MQSKVTKNTRAPNAEEKRFHAITKESDCICCGNPGPSIVEHCMGKSFRHNKELIGHWFVIPLCVECDNVTTKGSRRAFRNKFGPQSKLWFKHLMNTGHQPPISVVGAIEDFGQ